MSKEYFNSLLKRDDYKKENQLYLKKRVFLTFEKLIKVFFNKNILDLKNMLDLGSADGSLIEIAKKYGLNASGLDADTLNFEKDIFDFKDNHFDLITALSVIEHISNPQVFLKETRRVLADNGFFILITPDWEYSYRNFFDDPTHVKPYTKKSLFILLKMFGFKNIKIVPWLVCKPAWMWKVPFNFFLARNIPFDGHKNIFTRKLKFIPDFLKGKSKTLLTICQK